MIKYVIYLQSGEIVRTGSAPADQIANQVGGGERILINATANDAKQCVENDYIVDKKPFPAILEDNVFKADGVDSARLSAIPYDTTIVVNDIVAETYNVKDGEFDLAADLPGTYVLTCTHPRHLDGEYTIEGFSP